MIPENNNDNANTMSNTPPPTDDPEANNADGAGCMKRLVRWLFRCRHKWEANIFKGWECVEERCIKCNRHQHKPERGAHGWQPGRLPTRYTGHVRCAKCGTTHWLYGSCPPNA